MLRNTVPQSTHTQTFFLFFFSSAGALFKFGGAI